MHVTDIFVIETMYVAAVDAVQLPMKSTKNCELMSKESRLHLF